MRYIDPNTSTAEDVSGPQWASEVKAQVDLRTLKALFHNEDWVFVSVDAIAHPISTLPLTVFRKVVTNGEETLVREDDHPVAKRLKAPNRWQTRQQLVYSYAVDYTLAGNGILYDAPISRQIIHVPCERVQYDIGANLQPKGYLFYPDLEDQILATHGAAFVPLSQVMHCRRPNPSSSFWGLSPFIPGRRSVLFNRYSTDYLLAFYLKGAAPQMILEMDEKTKEANAVRLLRSFEMAFTGRRNQRRTLLLPKGMTAKIAENKIADQNLVELIRMNRETVLNILHVPKHVVSLQEAGGLGSEEHKTALRYFWQTTITDTATALADSLTAHYMAELGEDRVIAFDFSGVSELQDDEIGKAELAEKLLATMTLNEVRKRVWKLGPIEGGDSTPGKAPAFAQPPGTLPAGNAGEAGPANPPASDDDDDDEDPEEEPRSTEEPAPVAKTEQDAVSGTLTPPAETEPKTPEVLQAELGQRLMAKYGEGVKATDATMTDVLSSAGVALYEAQLDLFLAQTDAAVGALISESKGLRTKADDDEFEDGVGKPAEDAPSRPAVLTMEALRQALKESLDAMEADYMKGYMGTLDTTTDLGYDAQLKLIFDEKAREALAAVSAKDAKGRREILKARGLTTFKSVVKTTTENVMKVVEKGIAEGQTIDQVARGIVGYMRDNAQWRANMIARTETLTAFSIGNQSLIQTAAEVVPGMKKVWVTAADERVRESHKRVMAEVREHDKKFSNGLMYPRDPAGPAEETLQCRCTILTVPPEDLADYIEQLERLPKS